MIKRFAKIMEPILELSLIRKTRRNHGLEHATIHLLSQKHYQLSGRSDVSGFIVLGDVPTDKLENAVIDAIRRMKGGQHSLAVHPNCGTNLVTTAFLTTLIAFLGFSGVNRKNAIDRFGMVMVLMMVTVLYSPWAGASLQRHITTKGDIGELELVSVERRENIIPFIGRRVIVHQVLTTGG